MSFPGTMDIIPESSCPSKSSSSCVLASPLTRRNTNNSLPAITPVNIIGSSTPLLPSSSSSSSTGGGMMGTPKRRHSHTVNPMTGDRLEVVVTQIDDGPGSPPSKLKEYFPAEPHQQSLSLKWEQKKRADSAKKEADLARELGPALYNEFKARFKTFDLAKTGRVGADEIVTIYTATAGQVVSPAQTLRLQQAIASVDEDNSGDLDFPEFVAFIKLTQSWDAIPSSPRPDPRVEASQRFKWENKSPNHSKHDVLDDDETKQYHHHGDAVDSVGEALATSEEERRLARLRALQQTPVKRQQLEAELNKAADREAANLILALSREQQRRESHNLISPPRPPSSSSFVHHSSSTIAPAPLEGSFVSPPSQSRRNTHSNLPPLSTASLNRRAAAALLASQAAVAVDRPPSRLAMDIIGNSPTQSHRGLMSSPSTTNIHNNDNPSSSSSSSHDQSTSSIRKIRPRAPTLTLGPLPPLSDSAASSITSTVPSSPLDDSSFPHPSLTITTTSPPTVGVRLPTIHASNNSSGNTNDFTLSAPQATPRGPLTSASNSPRQSLSAPSPHNANPNVPNIITDNNSPMSLSYSNALTTASPHTRIQNSPSPQTTSDNQHAHDRNGGAHSFPPSTPRDDENDNEQQQRVRRALMVDAATQTDPLPSSCCIIM